MKRTRIISAVLLTAILLTAAVCLASCGGVKKSAEPSPIEGEWQCAETYLETDERYTGFYRLWVERDGTFSMYDCEAGNPGISGTVIANSDSELEFYCDKDDFDPPFEWKVDRHFKAAYRLDGDTLYITHSDRTLVFTKMAEEE